MATHMLPQQGSEAPEPTVTAGRRAIGGRRLLTRLGRGNRYDTWLAWDDERYTPVVVKALRRELVTDARALAALEAEAKALRELQHPAVVRAFGAAVTDPRPHLILEHLDGPRLSTLIRRSGPLAAEQIVPLGMQLSAALHYMHGRGWVHLDVKPRNVVMTGTPRLIDLSVARTVDAAAAITGLVGTDAYMAPEQCTPDRFREIGPKADVWGACATLYEALAGTRPFGASEERFSQLRTPLPAMPPKAPPALWGALRAGLEADPLNRPSAAELYRALEPLSDWAAHAIRRLR